MTSYSGNNFCGQLYLKNSGLNFSSKAGKNLQKNNQLVLQEYCANKPMSPCKGCDVGLFT